MNTQHTPGPWVAHTNWGDTFIKSATDDLVFFLSVEDGVKTADLRLMAAAPDLLEALQLCEGNIDSLLASAHPKVFGIWLDVVRAAIAKATGDKA